MSRAGRQEFNVREMLLQRIREGHGILRREGAPPYSGKPGYLATSAYLQEVYRMHAEEKDAGEVSNQLRERQSKKSYPSDGHVNPINEDKVATNEANDAADTIYQLRKEILAYQTEREVLRARTHMLKQRCAEKDKEISSLKRSTGTFDDPSSRSEHLVKALKQQVIDLKQAMSRKEKQLRSVQLSVEATKIDELIMERDAYYNEVLRLRNQMEEGTVAEDIDDGRGNLISPTPAMIRSLFEEHRALEREHERLKQDFEAVVGKLEEALPDSQTSGKFSSMSRKELVAEAQRQNDDLDDVKKERDALVQRANKLDEKVEEQSRLIRAQEAELDRLRGSAASLEAANNDLRRDIFNASSKPGGDSVVTSSASRQHRAHRGPDGRVESAANAIRAGPDAGHQKASVSRMKNAEAAARARSTQSTSHVRRLSSDNDGSDDDIAASSGRAVASAEQDTASSHMAADALSVSQSDLRSALATADADESESRVSALEREGIKLRSRAATKSQQRKVEKQQLKVDTKKLDEAAVAIQSALRGHMTRSRLSKRLQDQDWVTVSSDAAQAASARPRQVTSASNQKRQRGRSHMPVRSVQQADASSVFSM